MGKLTDKQVAAEQEFLKGLPRVNLGALLMPGIWGPAHGFWVAILFYPLWLLVDNLTYAAYKDPSGLAVALAVAAWVFIVAFTVGFAIVCQPIAAHKADAAGVSREVYLKRQRMWTIVCAIIAAVALAWATFYNLEIREVV